MKQAPTRSQRSKQIQSMAILAMFTGIIFLLTFTPLGLIDLPVIKATILHVPVIIGSILLGPKKGAFLGVMFGLSSMIKNTLVPGLSSFVFSPLIPVPGLDRGSPWALFICFVPRILVGVTPWLAYTFIKFLFRKSNAGVQTTGMVIAGIVGALTNTALVMGSIGVIFTEAYAAAQGIPATEVLAFILGIVAMNGVPEAIVAAVVTPAVCVPLVRALKLEKAPVVQPA
ncbi:ECF transporter S component [Pseudoflavonifractor phocaeensis]|uniref:ECF transporter S component n=1 Tax=Pseudoflavonifractor phocaeensis TaxID=1870988 RepID=UPI001959C7CE|nr:ECF transporter S component [Pseudoflavonifractor phocaeensis]MBM6925494.1 ECF transporter S component [Pseudoflavonifractor phocaeensis]